MNTSPTNTAKTTIIIMATMGDDAPSLLLRQVYY